MYIYIQIYIYRHTPCTPQDLQDKENMGRGANKAKGGKRKEGWDGQRTVHCSELLDLQYVCVHA